MLRKLLIVGVFAGSSASVPILYQANPEAFHQLLAPSTTSTEEEEKSVKSVLRTQPKAAPEVLLGKKVRLPADARGHFSADFKFNGRPVEALVDTGATVVAINLSTARRIGLNLGKSDFIYEVDTANGAAKAATATIDSMAIGRIYIEKVDAVILEDSALKGALVGMNFLNRLGKYQVENGSLLLVQ